MANSKRPHGSSHASLAGEQRINKLLAAAGLGSRRQVDELIEQGRVELDGKTITQVGIKVDADKVRITVDGEMLKRHRPVYFAVNKPAGVLCTNRDPEGRPRVIDFVPGHHRLFPVGRLDAASTGLILLTNDGELAQRLAHPKHSVPKNYFVVVAGQVPPDAMRRLQRGIYLAEGLARVDGAKIRRVRKGCTEIDITLSEGKNREIRRVLARLGHRVVTLHRTAIGPLKLANLPEGASRPLSAEEVDKLYNAVDEIKRAKKQARKLREQEKIEREHSDSTLDSKQSRNQNDKLEIENGDEAQFELPTHKKNPKRAEPRMDAKKRTSKKKAIIQSPENEADDMLESLPELSENPFAQPEDLENSIDDGLGGALLVKDHSSGEESGKTRGKVLGYDVDSDTVDLDSVVKLSGETTDSLDDDEALATSESGDFNPWSQARPKRPARPRAGGERAESNRRSNSRTRNREGQSNRPRRSNSGGALQFGTDRPKPRRSGFSDRRAASSGSPFSSETSGSGEARPNRSRKPRSGETRTTSNSRGSASGARRPTGDRSHAKKSRYGKGRSPRQR